MSSATEVNRYQNAEKIGLLVRNLEDELAYYKSIVETSRDGGSDPDLEKKLHEFSAKNSRMRKQLIEHGSATPCDDWFFDVFGKRMPAPNTWPFKTFKKGTPWSDNVVYGMEDGEILYAEHLLEILEKEGISGDIVEFGIYFGHWLQVICETLEKHGWNRKVWGFDSFEGLPESDPNLNPDCWTAGMYSAPFDEVSARLQLDKREYLNLVKG